MANIYRGEVTVSVAGRAYTLRPTFHILCQIEERIGLSVPQLLERMAQKGLLASEILMVLAIASRHDGSRPFDSETVMDMPADKVNLHAVMPALAEFFVAALGGKKQTESPPSMPTQDVQNLDYKLLLETAYKVLRLEPTVFWQLTMPEFRVLLRAARPRKSAPIEQNELQALMHRFPDATQANANIQHRGA